MRTAGKPIGEIRPCGAVIAVSGILGNGTEEWDFGIAQRATEGRGIGSGLLDDWRT